MNIPTDRKYSESHEWFLAEGKVLTIGITQYAADELTDITYVELPEVGTQITPDEPCGGIESVKAYSELYSAIAGKVMEVNAKLEDNPGLVNQDAFGDGWMLKIEATESLDELMDADAYEKHIASGG